MAEADIKIYAQSMAGIRDRINIIQTVNVNQVNIPSTTFKAEFMFLQFRKVLEEIAFSTIAANKDAYSALHAKFSVHWKAKAILEEVKKLNADFYPNPLQAPMKIAEGHHHFEAIADGYMTPDEFVTLYEASSEIVHTRNPYKEGDKTIDAKYTVQEWVGRIQKLLGWHRAQLLSGDVWIIQIPHTGDVRVYPATPTA